MSDSPFGKPGAHGQAPIQQTIVHVQGPPPSQALPALVNLFCWTGIGQLIQGRILAAMLFAGAEIVAMVSCWVVVGFFVWPIVRILAVIDAAKYNPNNPSNSGALLALVAAGVVAMAASIGLVFVLVAGSAIVATNSGSDTIRVTRTENASEPTTQQSSEKPTNSTPEETPAPRATTDPKPKETPANEPEENPPILVEKKKKELTPFEKSFAEAAEFRTWTSTIGTEISARFVSVIGKTVTLEKRDGKKIKLPLEKLSDADQAFIAAKRKK